MHIATLLETPAMIVAELSEYTTLHSWINDQGNKILYLLSVMFSTSFQSYINKILVEEFNGSVMMYCFVMVYLNDTLIYTNGPNQSHVNAVCWILDRLQKHKLFC